MVASPFEGGNVCLRSPGSIGEGVDTLSRERGSCVSRVYFDSSSVADETPSPLLSGEVLLATVLREEGTDFWPKNRFFFIVINYFLAFFLPKSLFPMSKFLYNYLM